MTILKFIKINFTRVIKRHGAYESILSRWKLHKKKKKTATQSREKCTDFHFKRQILIRRKQRDADKTALA